MSKKIIFSIVLFVSMYLSFGYIGQHVYAAGSCEDEHASCLSSCGTEYDAATTACGNDYETALAGCAEDDTACQDAAASGLVDCQLNADGSYNSCADDCDAALADCTEGVLCPDGTYADTIEDCPVLCPDGTYAPTIEDCPMTYTYCPKPSAGLAEQACNDAHPESGATCVADESVCPHVAYCSGVPNAGDACAQDHPDSVCEGTTDAPPCDPHTHYFCGDEQALNASNYDACRAANTNPNDPCVRDDSVCEYCTQGNTDPRCKVTFCGAVERTDCQGAQTYDQCQQANPDMTCIRDDSVCECGSTSWYCPTDPEEPQRCEDNKENSDVQCQPDENLCKDYCGYDVIVEYTFKGVKYQLEIVASYWYDRFTESCTMPTTEYLTAYIASVLDPLPSPPPCTGDSCGGIVTVDDQCDNIEGTQSYDDFIANYTRDTNGDCVPHIVCNDPQVWCPQTESCTLPEECPVNGVCGVAEDTCIYGTVEHVVSSGGTATWDCIGVNGGTPANCSKTLGNPGVCGSANGTNPINSTSVTLGSSLYPASRACSSGSPDSAGVSLAGGVYSWSCDGTGGSNVNVPCSAPAIALCGNALGTSVDPATIVNNKLSPASRECTSGTGSNVSFDQSVKRYNWSCDLSGVASAQCWANKVCGGSIPCHDGAVELDKIKVVPPITQSGGGCHVDWTNAFISYQTSGYTDPTDPTVATNCKLLNQDGVLPNVDGNGNDTFQPGATNPSLGYTENSVKKDTRYILKCWDGPDESTATNVQTTTTTCRINVKQGEFN
jgi:hypothetical protein